MTRIITFANFKGGTGKTTNAVLFAYTLAKQGYKVLVVDKDPQANATTFLLKTYMTEREETPVISNYMLDGVKAGDLATTIFTIHDNLDLIPNTPTFHLYPKFLQKKFPGMTDQAERERIFYFRELLESIQDEYDFILIDVPPTISDITDAALAATDYVVLVLQTQEASLDGAEVFINYLQDLLDEDKAQLEIVGILPVILKADSRVEQATMQNAIAIFGEENLFEHRVKTMERIKRFNSVGITNDDMHDHRVHNLYDEIVDEFIKRIVEIEED